MNFPYRKAAEQHKLAERQGGDCVRMADEEVTWLHGSTNYAGYLGILVQLQWSFFSIDMDKGRHTDKQIHTFMLLEADRIQNYYYYQCILFLHTTASQISSASVAFETLIKSKIIAMPKVFALFIYRD